MFESSRSSGRHRELTLRLDSLTFRLYSTVETPEVPLSATEQIEQIANKASQLTLQASKLNDQGEYKSAESLLEGALALRAKIFAELKKAHDGPATPDDWSIATAQIQSSLAYSKTALTKWDEALALYSTCLPVIETFMKAERDRGVILSNYAEALYGAGKPHDAIVASQQALEILKQHHRDDEIIAANLSNLAGYLCTVKKYTEAKPHSAAALKIFLNKLGKRNRYTKEAWSNYYALLKELGLDEEAKDLEADWRAAHEGVTSKKSQELNQKQVEDIRRRVEERFYGAKRAEPTGTVKDPKFYREELADFVEQWQKKGLDIDDPAHESALKKEYSALRRGEKQGRQSLENETERLANIASVHGEDWSTILEEMDAITKDAQATDDMLHNQRQTAHKTKEEDIASRPKKEQGPSKEILAELARLKVERAAKAKARAEAEKAAAEAAAKAAADAASKGKGKKKK